jgi:hypothetical protein
MGDSTTEVSGCGSIAYEEDEATGFIALLVVHPIQALHANAAF